MNAKPECVSALAMHMFRKQHYVVRLRHSSRLRYRLARFLVGAIPVLLLALVAGFIAYLLARHS
jgi:hypothetical protein